jgi:hypothetical protein
VVRGVTGTNFIVGDVDPLRAAELGYSRWETTSAYENLPLATDDWPNLYLRARQIPAAYWQSLLAIGAVAMFFLVRLYPGALRPNWHFWFLGAAFLLVEFSSITRLALLFGTTWLVNALAITGVLLMILGANIFVLLTKRINLARVYLLLFASIVLVYFFPLDALNGLPIVSRGLLAVIILSVPLLFSGIIFSESLKREGDISRMLASNLAGSVGGGILEYSSILWGTQSLYITGALMYLLAFLARRRR